MRYLFSLVVLLSAAQLCRDQVDTGAITGSVKDASGAVVVGAKVKITETETGITLTLVTNGDGFFSTHMRYCNLLAKDQTRESVLEAFEKRHVYGSTDNILADVRSG